MFEIVWSVYNGCVAEEATQEKIANFMQLANKPGNSYVGLFCHNDQIVEVQQTPSGNPKLTQR